MNRADNILLSGMVNDGVRIFAVKPAMGAHTVELSKPKVETFSAHRLPLQDDLISALTPAEKAFIAAIGLLLADGLTGAVDAAAKRFLEAAPTPKAARRRAHALLRLAGERHQ
jgi:hypothetical protein